MEPRRKKVDAKNRGDFTKINFYDDDNTQKFVMISAYDEELLMRDFFFAFLHPRNLHNRK